MALKRKKHSQISASDSLHTGEVVGSIPTAPTTSRRAAKPDLRLIQRLLFVPGHALDIEAGHKRAEGGNRILNLHALPAFIVG